MLPTRRPLVQVFINEVFEGEKAVYETEGLSSDMIHFTDNAQVLEMTYAPAPAPPAPSAPQW